LCGYDRAPPCKESCGLGSLHHVIGSNLILSSTPTSKNSIDRRRDLSVQPSMLSSTIPRSIALHNKYEPSLTTRAAMKLLTLNFLTCAVKSCKSTSESFPLHPKDCELVSDTLESDPKLLLNVLPRLDWAALSTTASEVCVSRLPSRPHILTS
jgi:hypothetical protein